MDRGERRLVFLSLKRRNDNFVPSCPRLQQNGIEHLLETLEEDESKLAVMESYYSSLR